MNLIASLSTSGMWLGMARPLRIEYSGAVYHIICRGNNRQNVFKDDRDRKRYLEKLVYYCELKEVALLSYCLLSNHIHLLVETPQGNLSKMLVTCIIRGGRPGRYHILTRITWLWNQQTTLPSACCLTHHGSLRDHELALMAF